MTVRVVGVGLAHEDADLAARISGIGGVPLVAVDHVFVAVAHDRRLDVGRVAGRNIGLGHSEAGANFAVQQWSQPALLMFWCAVTRQHFHVAGIRRRAVEHFRRQQRAAHDLAERCVFEISQARAMLRFRQEQIPQALLAGDRLQFINQRQHTPRPNLLRLFDVTLLIGIDIFRHERTQTVLQLLHLGGRIVRHGNFLDRVKICACNAFDERLCVSYPAVNPRAVGRSCPVAANS